jgi:uncharacterized protein involved in propanediol utilization
VTGGGVAERRDTPMGARSGFGVCFGTFGELLQGALAGPDEDFLVTLPIARWSTARITLTPEGNGLVVEPATKLKAQGVATSMLADAGVAPHGRLVLAGDLPEGKGMASSSADVVATVRAVADALGIAVPPRRIEDHLRGVEPTDGLMYRDVVAFYHRRVELHGVLGPVPALTVVGIDEGGQVDTVRFNAALPPITPARRREYRLLLDRLATALPAGDLTTIGRVATRSALLNQDRCPKTHLAEALRICGDLEALGVTVAHSGTLVGILVSGDDPHHAAKVTEVVAACRELSPAVTVDHTLRFPSAPRLAEAAAVVDGGRVHAEQEMSPR